MPHGVIMLQAPAVNLISSTGRPLEQIPAAFLGASWLLPVNALPQHISINCQVRVVHPFDLVALLKTPACRLT